jgi:cyclic beta-1,2-glucan synthetase
LARPSAAPAWAEEQPIRSELFSIERLEQHAESLAANQPVSSVSSFGNPLSDRLRDNEKTLLRVYRELSKVAEQKRSVTPAAEWLLDNYRLVEQQVLEARADLPPGYYRQLPKLSDGPLAGYPRVVGIAWAYVAHTDSRFDPATLIRFVAAYQRVQPLTIGELWAIAITVRIVLVENLRRLAEHIVLSRAAYSEANTIADRLIGVNGLTADPSALKPYETAPLTEAFIVQLVQRLRDQDPNAMPAVRWLDSRLAQQGLNADDLVRKDHQQQGAINVTVRNIITSMRLVSDVDWTKLFEKVSPVDDVLRSAGTFETMDFATRNLYRTAIEQIARGTSLDEVELARRACAMADSQSSNGDPRYADPGYYLIGKGRSQFERSVSYREVGWAARRRILATGLTGYVFAVAYVSSVILFIPLFGLAHTGLAPWQLAIMAAMGLLPAVDAGLMLINRLATHIFGATLLPALDLSNGVPADLRTLIAVPSLLSSEASIRELIERLEVHYLSNPTGALHFALVSDWTDADGKSTDSDAALLAIATDGIGRLNERYPVAEGGVRFLLLHRHRVWSDTQQRWIGWERKRGKLHELNRLLRGSTGTTFLTGDYSKVPTSIKYVVTLDSDTRLPRDSVFRLVGKMAHPLNQAKVDPHEGRVVEGYGILQPRVTPSLSVGEEGSFFQRIFSGNSGIDPYSSAISDVYQDLFGEGSYSGKGIYDVDAFEAALNERVPDGTMLSHDLFEGVFARSGLVSDVEVIEEYPSRYDVASARQHRWVRGDWQLLPWMGGLFDIVLKKKDAAAIPAVGLWKMFDNLRRSLSAPAALLALLVGWTLPLSSALVWTAFVMLVIALPTLLPLISGLLPRRRDVNLRGHLESIRQDAVVAASQTGMLIVFLPHQAWQMVDAVTRTVFRLTVSRRNLLQWTTAAQSAQRTRTGWLAFYSQMAASLVVAAVSAVFVWLSSRASLPIAGPFIVAWAISPAIARWVSFPPADAARLGIHERDGAYLRLVARRTWRFFETFVTEADHMLPPDNFQEDPKPVIAHRTSPTNLGLYLLSVVSAREFGWVGTQEAVQRIEATLATMERLGRFRGHFFNWYDTSDLRPLDPPYISSVDSGNLAGHLIALSGACTAWSGHPVVLSRLTSGAADGLALAREALAALPDETREHLEKTGAPNRALDSLDADLQQPVPGGEHTARRLARLAEQSRQLTDLVRSALEGIASDQGLDFLFWVEATQRSLESHHRDVVESADTAALKRRLQTVAMTSRAMALAMEFEFLLNQERRLLSIGYLVNEDQLDPSCYDLLASEARLASFVAIAAGEAPTRHWFRLGRTVTPVGLGAALISWSGSMFEYLMPSLVMRAPLGSLLERTNELIVRRQIEYVAPLGVPWGISESAYNARDKELTYQYSNFGVPGLGLKRGLAENIVIAPYATALATMVDPPAALANFTRLAAIGGRGRYGFYEAIDFTPARLPDGQTHAVVHAYMAHHQGMSVVALANALLDGVMRDYFHADPMIRATELLLQERTPRDVAAALPRTEEETASASVEKLDGTVVRRLRNPHAPNPSTHLLSNGRYSVMITATGSGYSRWGATAITRWREDVTRDDFGAYFYLRDVETDAVWSATYQPCGTRPDSYDVMFAEDRAEFIRRDGALTTTVDVVVSPESDAEVRRVSITNGGNTAREIEFTSYSEIVLATPIADAAHQTFSKLFIETEYLASTGALLATRRRRAPDEQEIWAAHMAVVEGDEISDLEVETDRSRFIGRGNDIGTPVSVVKDRRLSNSVGTVLDPVFVLRRRLRIPPGAVARISFWTMAAGTREAILDLIDQHHDSHGFERATTLAWTQEQVQLRHLDITQMQASLFQRLAGHVLYANPALRSSSDTIRRGLTTPPTLWSQGISGDVPIVLVRIDEIEDSGIVREMLRAHEYWRLKGLVVDLVILNERGASYVQDLQVALETMVRTSRSTARLGGGVGSIFVLRTDLISAETRALLLAVARVVLLSRRGSLADQLDQIQTVRAVPPAARRKPVVDATPRPEPPPVSALASLQFFNGLGGFSPNDREYITVLGPGQSTPAPWINVVSNPNFGFQVAVDGGGYTWSQNSRDNQLTPWSNDPVCDRPGEILYVRDLDSGELWSPTALPIRLEAPPYIARHGKGYSRFEVVSKGIALELLVYVPLEDPIKICRLTVRNLSDRSRRLSVTAYVDWVLGLSRSAAASTVSTELDAATGAIFARNPWNMNHGTRVAFADLGGKQTAWTADRREFIGRNCTAENPAALSGDIPLSQRVGAGLDPCAALQTVVELKRGASTEIVFFLGQAENAGEARALIERYRSIDLEAVYRDVVAFWNETLGAVQVKTPDRALDIMLNGWLLYQTLACRYWARSAFYQASGAYGFRDQLQDVMALMLTRPDMSRAHILRAAARQFVEGDVQHWWFPPAGQGVRTRISDDRAWLAYVTAQYVRTTSDLAILDEKIPFIDGPPLRPGDHDLYNQPGISDETATLFEHCARGLDHSLAIGIHGLPLMGTGDWNDGMNRVGEAGRGESVWLGWFLHATLKAFIPIAEARGDTARLKAWTEHAASLRAALDREGWDGEWYRRGYYDDGTPLGSVDSEECRIDSIAQSWAAISGAGNPARVAKAMESLDKMLIDRTNRLALLFSPPFNKTSMEPGYIKGYPPGLRENGGQYTHAAAWSIMGFAALGQGDKAAELFSLINPINHSNSRANIHRYKVEPYVAAADVYSVAPHAGRGGWTWYTGSAGWLYRAGIESILGLRLEGDILILNPCIPTGWKGFDLKLRHKGADYEIVVLNPDGVSRGVIGATLNGVAHAPSEEQARVPLALAEGPQTIQVTMGHVQRPAGEDRAD